MIVYAVCLLQALGPTTPPPPSTFREIKDTLVARFNRGDYKAIYQAGDDIYKGLNSEAELVGELEWSKNNVGNIVSSELIENLGRVEHFKWTGEKGVMKFELWLEGPAIRRYKFNTSSDSLDGRSGPSPPTKRLRTATGFGRRQLATIYLSDPKEVGLPLGLSKGATIQLPLQVRKGTGRIPDDRTIFSLGSISAPLP